MRLSKVQRKAIADLRVQAMIFDMDIDWETATLTPKTRHIDAFWLTRWKDKKNQSDLDEYFDYDRSES